MKSDSQLDDNLCKLISAASPVQSRPEFKKALFDKLVHVVNARKRTTSRRHAVWQIAWRHPALYAGISAAAVLLIAFLFLHVEQRAPDASQTASISHSSSPAGALAEDEALNRMLKEIKYPNQPDLSVKPLGWDIKPPRPCGWDIKPPRPCGWDIKPLAYMEGASLQAISYDI